MKIDTKDKDVLMEITGRCPGNCSYCYKANSVGPKNNHVPLELIKKRVEWVMEYIDVKEIIILGGEPLLHPEFKKVCEFILSKGLSLGIITAGMVPHNNKNIDYLFELLSEGKISLELSLHPEKNENQYKNFMNRVMDLKKPVTVNSIATLSRDTLESKDRFLRIHEFVFQLCGFNIRSDTINVNKKKRLVIDHIISQYEIARHHFAPTQQYGFYAYKITFSLPYCDTKLNFTARGVDEITPVLYVAHGAKNNGRVCSGMRSSIEEDKISLSSLLVKTDGEMSFGSPSCIATGRQLGNCDKLKGHKEVFDRFYEQLEWIRKNIFRTKAEENLEDELNCCKSDPRYKEEINKRGIKPDDHFCTSCNFNKACQECHKLK